MTVATTTRTAPTDAPILDVLAERWSPRAYDHAATIDEDKLASALEAARWSPSAYNNQPWRFIVGRRGTATFDALAGSLVEFNAAWATKASVLIAAVAEHSSEEGRTFATAHYDLGQAVAHLSVQAHADGLVVHQMTGFDPAAVHRDFALPERFEVVTMIALGEFGDPSTLPEPLGERELAPRERRPLSETLLSND